MFSVSVAISYCSSLLQSPGYTSCEFAMVECRRFAVGIFMICHSFGDITTSGYLAAMLDFRHEVASAMTAGLLHV